MSSTFKAVFYLNHFESTWAVGIKRLESFLAQSFPQRSKCSDNSIEEFLETNGSSTIGVKVLENVSSFGLWNVNFEISQSWNELIEINLTRPICVHELKLLFEANYTFGASFSYLFFK
jgi:hypothetical protein